MSTEAKSVNGMPQNTQEKVMLIFVDYVNVCSMEEG